VNEFVELANWFGWRAPHEPVVVDSLPTPAFMIKDRPQVSFSTNNYLGLATSPRMKAAATRGIEAYGVGNSDSRLLGGNLGLYGELERKIARSNGKSHAILFATGYLTNLGALSTLPRATQIARAFGFAPAFAKACACRARGGSAITTSTSITSKPCCAGRPPHRKSS
jgi:glycine C-acetyltransferase